MKVKSFRLQNYRCFEDSGDIPLTHFSVFIGNNDGGKSSALIALDKLLSGKPFEDDDHRRTPAEEGHGPVIADELEVSAILEDLDETEHKYRYVRKRDSENGTVTQAYELQQQCVGDPDLDVCFGDLTLSQLSDLCGKLELTVEGPRNRKESFIQVLQEYRDSLPQKMGWVPAPKGFRDQLPKSFLYHEDAQTNPEETIKKTLADYYKNYIIPKHRSALEEVRETVTNQLNEEARKYVPILREHCKTVRDISVDLGETSFENIQVGSVRIEQQGGIPVDWTRIGRGKRREMSLAVFRFHAKLLTETLESPTEEGETVPDTLALFDEPDLNLDYGAQRRVNQILQDLASHEHCQVLVATHSVNLIDSTSLKQICFFDSSDGSNEVNCFDPGEDGEVLEVIRDSMGLRNSAFFNEKLFVVCEGPTEIAGMPVLYSHITGSSPSLSGVYLVNGLDNEEAKRIAKVLKKNGRLVHLVLDKDCQKADGSGPFSKNELEKAGLDPAKEVTFIGKTEYEDAFDDNLWLDVLNKFYTKLDGDAWTAEEMQSAHESRKFSKSILEAVIASSRPVSKPELGYRLATEAIMTDRIPNDLAELMKYLKQRLN